MKHQKVLLGYALPLLCGLTFANFSQLDAQNSLLKDAQSDSVGECSKEFLISYFPPNIVETSLEKFNVPKEKYPAITKDLADNEKNIISKVEEKASKITPNPLKDPQQRQVAVKIFRETLMDIFSEVMNKNNVTDDKQIQAMLEDIQQQKAKKFAECLERHKKPAEGESTNKLPKSTTEDKLKNHHNDENDKVDFKDSSFTDD